MFYEAIIQLSCDEFSANSGVKPESLRLLNFFWQRTPHVAPHVTDPRDPHHSTQLSFGVHHMVYQYRIETQKKVVTIFLTLTFA